MKNGKAFDIKCGKLHYVVLVVHMCIEGDSMQILIWAAKCTLFI